jgi:c-di-GMP phosphodiesterase
VFRWASLLVLSGYDDCPIGYLGFALQRARACELVAQSYRIPSQLAYLMGILSTLDSVLNAPLADILMPLPLEGEVKRAILQREGDLGSVLDAVLGYEAGDFEVAALHGIPLERMQHGFWEAVEYSAAMLSDLKTATPAG